MPEGSGLVAGPIVGHFTDKRIPWAAQALGGLHSKSILELGPYEAYNTYQMEAMGAQVTSIESSNVNFLKCLIVKNTFGLRTTFMLGDFIPFLETARTRYDVLWASGVLYHMTDPIRFLCACANVADKVFIWTQYYDPEIIENDPNQKAFFQSDRDLEVPLKSTSVKLRYRSYSQAKGTLFSGGSDDYSYWMSKEDIFSALASLGLTEITMGMDVPTFGNGPACFFIASRK